MIHISDALGVDVAPLSTALAVQVAKTRPYSGSPETLLRRAPSDVPWSVLVQPMASLTDLALGLVTLYLVPRVPRNVEGARYWRAAFAWAAVTALVGAVYHGYLVDVPQAGEVTWAVMSTMVVLVMSFLLAASVVQVLGRSRAIVFWPLRLLGVAAYAIVAATGHPSITAIMLCESLTMACVIGLWVWAWLRRHPSGRPMLIAIAVSIAGALLRLVPGAAALMGLDPDSAYHIGQIVGMVLLFRAVARSGPRLETDYDTRPGRTSRVVGPSPTSVDNRRRTTKWIKATQLRRRHFRTRQ